MAEETCVFEIFAIDFVQCYEYRECKERLHLYVFSTEHFLHQTTDFLARLTGRTIDTMSM